MNKARDYKLKNILPMSSVVQTYSKSWVEYVESKNANISKLPFWVMSAARSHGLLDQVMVLLWTDNDGDIYGLIPVRIHNRTMTGVPLRTLEVGAGLVAYHQDWLGICDVPDAFDDLITYALDNRCDALHFSGVPHSSHSFEILLARSEDAFSVIHGNGEISPVLKIDIDWEGYLDRCAKKWRYLIKKMLRSIEENPEIDVQWVSRADNLDELFKYILYIEARSWKANEGTAITPDSLEYRYYRYLLPSLANAGALAANVIKYAGIPVAYNLCYLWNGEMGSMKTSFDQSHANISPGTLAYCSSVRYAFEQGAHTYDFLGDRAQHKTKWTSHMIHHSDFLFLMPTLTSRLARTLRGVYLPIRCLFQR